jgi:hypothetical protein
LISTIVVTAAACSHTSPSQPSATSAPAVASVSPAVGDAGGGTTVTITGANFTNATSVKFAGTSALSFVVTSDTVITAISPLGATGTFGDVTVSNAAGTSSANSFDQFSWGQNALANVSLSAASVTGGTPVTCTITLLYQAPTAGITLPITWTSDPANSTSVILPRTVTVQGTSATVSFQISTFYVSSAQTIVVSSSYNDLALSATLTLTP